jgi:UDP-N-acetylmuramyl pentapeptide phosphotransferase/UDP-N-acetylglucosamine-1-phosphate transferase
VGLGDFIPVVIFIITAVSNGANLTDGIDGLAAGTYDFSIGYFTRFRKYYFLQLFKYVYP